MGQSSRSCIFAGQDVIEELDFRQPVFSHARRHADGAGQQWSASAMGVVETAPGPELALHPWVALKDAAFALDFSQVAFDGRSRSSSSPKTTMLGFRASPRPA
jgi:hypothetical protein